MMQHASDINLKLKFAFTRTNSIDYISGKYRVIEIFMNYYYYGFLVALDWLIKHVLTGKLDL